MIWLIEAEYGWYFMLEKRFQATHLEDAAFIHISMGDRLMTELIWRVIYTWIAAIHVLMILILVLMSWISFPYRQYFHYISPRFRINGHSLSPLTGTHTIISFDRLNIVSYWFSGPSIPSTLHWSYWLVSHGAHFSAGALGVVPRYTRALGITWWCLLMYDAWANSSWWYLWCWYLAIIDASMPLDFIAIIII